MARYSTFKYGSGQEYGTSPISTNLLWSLLVDWDNDGFFDGTNEAELMVDFSLSRGRDHFIAPNGQGFEKYQAGKCSVTLDNTDGRYNPFNTSSPLYPYVAPGKSVRIAVKNGSAGTDYSLMRGKIADIQPYNNRGRRLVKIDIIDGQQFLADRTVKIGLRQGNYPFGISDSINTTGYWVDLILERANWPENEWPVDYYDYLIDYNGQLEEGSTENFFTQLAYAWFWNKNAMEAVRELEDTELGTFLHDRNGNARFLSQHFTYDDVTAIDESQILKDISIPQPWESLRNRIEINVNQIKLHEIDGILGGGLGSELLWSIGDVNENAIFIRSDSSFTVDAQFRWQNFNNIVPDNIFIDFEVRTVSNGTGTDLSSQCILTISEIGNGATITLQNTSAFTGYIVDLSIYGDAIYADYESLAIAEDEDSINTYGSRVFRLKSPWMQAPDHAESAADFLLENLKDPAPFPEIKIENRPTVQFPLDLYVNAIWLTSDELGINKIYRIGKIQHDWLGENGQATLTTLKLEPYFAVDAPIVLDYSLYSPFSHPDETDATPVSPPLMDWTITFTQHDELNSGALEIGYIRCSLGGAPEKTATTTISHVIVANEVLSYYYKYADTDAGIEDSVALNLTVVTTESGTIINQAVPFILSDGSSGWHQDIINIPAENIGETITTITFTKPLDFVLALSNVYLDSIGIGVIIG